MRLLFFILAFFALLSSAHGQDHWLVTDRPECGDPPVECQVQWTEIELRIDGVVSNYEIEQSDLWGTLVFGGDQCGRPVIMLMSLAGIGPAVMDGRGRWGADAGNNSGWSPWSPVLRTAGCSLRLVMDKAPEPPDPPDPPPVTTWNSKDDFTAVWAVTGGSFSFKLKASETPQDGIVMYLGSDQTLLPYDQGGWQYDKASILVQLSDDGVIRVSDGTQYRNDVSVQYGTGTHNVEVIPSLELQSYSVKVDGQTIATGYSFRASATDLTQICLQGYPQGANGLFAVTDHRGSN